MQTRGTMGRRLSPPLRLSLLLGVVLVLGTVAVEKQLDFWRREACLMSLTAIKNAEESYYLRYGRFIVGDSRSFQRLQQATGASLRLTCPDGGHFYAMTKKNGDLEIHCTGGDDDSFWVTAKPVDPHPPPANETAVSR